MCKPCRALLHRPVRDHYTSGELAIYILRDILLEFLARSYSERLLFKQFSTSCIAIIHSIVIALENGVIAHLS